MLASNLVNVHLEQFLQPRIILGRNSKEKKEQKNIFPHELNTLLLIPLCTLSFLLKCQWNETRCFCLADDSAICNYATSRGVRPQPNSNYLNFKILEVVSIIIHQNDTAAYVGRRTSAFSNRQTPNCYCEYLFDRVLLSPVLA